MRQRANYRCMACCYDEMHTSDAYCSWLHTLYCSHTILANADTHSDISYCLVAQLARSIFRLQEVLARAPPLTEQPTMPCTMVKQKPYY